MKHKDFLKRKAERLEQSRVETLIHSRQFQSKKRNAYMMFLASGKASTVNAVISEVFKGNNQTTNQKDFEMKAVKIWKESVKVNEMNDVIANFEVKTQNDIKTLMDKLESMANYLLKLNNRKGVEKWEKYHIDSIAKDIAQIGLHYENIKASNVSQLCKYKAFENLKNRMQAIFETLKEKYSIED